jgi:hypothetical protein
MCTQLLEAVTFHIPVVRRLSVSGCARFVFHLYSSILRYKTKSYQIILPYYKYLSLLAHCLFFPFLVSYPYIFDATQSHCYSS